MSPKIHRLALIAAVVALCVIVLGAWVRLSHAGLGCPDWPGCYGKLTWPTAHHEVSAANEAFPERPVEVHKAWREMVHRYLAGTLVLLVLAINWMAWRGERSARPLRGIAAVTLVLILFQAALGMWTVTLKLMPIVVMGHLLGGMATLGLLSWIAFRSGRLPYERITGMRGMVLAALGVLVLQIALGGWTSANYAALACPDLPKCTGQWMPETDFAGAFTVSREVGVNYEGGILDQPARAAIHITHRIGAIVTLLFLLATGLRLMHWQELRSGALALMTLVSLQFCLGLLNVHLKLPLANAVAHNGVAALLIACLVWLLARTTVRRA
ncbi:heme A synthase [Marinihelvus fidelis]|uniref:Heme A synthase n=1 Tax=Marinihelvus fidelis TaxID=2613842 RepID=A0A5N0TF08_9GAMM|nr:COX15/CtaA family protein [Marinihelvus fidelis]KAA9131839.1 heme A synthase [Marinihelvus fidelis]